MDYIVAAIIVLVAIVALVVHFKGQAIALDWFKVEAKDVYDKMVAEFNKEVMKIKATQGVPAAPNLLPTKEQAEPIPFPKPGLPIAPTPLDTLVPTPVGLQVASTAAFTDPNRPAVIDSTDRTGVNRDSKVIERETSWLNIPTGPSIYTVKDVRTGEEKRFQIGGGTATISFIVDDPNGHVVFAYKCNGAGSMLGFIPLMDGDYTLYMQADSVGTLNHWQGAV